jgi:hypothetical protein
LHRRELDGGLPDLDENEPPGFSAKELVDWQRLRPGEKWVLRMQEAAAQANLTLTIFSKAYFLATDTQSDGLRHLRRTWISRSWGEPTQPLGSQANVRRRMSLRAPFSAWPCKAYVVTELRPPLISKRSFALPSPGLSTAPLESALVFLQEVNTICCGRRSDPLNHAMSKRRKPGGQGDRFPCGQGRRSDSPAS